MKSIVFENRETPGLVSIITPARNAEKYIAVTLNTIGSQTYREWELIVVEDGSTGQTQKIVAEFSKGQSNKVVYARNDRSYGAGHTRNVAFSKAAGEYIALLDADDRWKADHLESAVQNLGKSGKDIVYSTVQMVADGTDEVLGYWGPTASEVENFPETIFARSFVTPSATVMRRSVIEDVGPWSTTHRYCEDFDYWLRCIAAGKSFQFIEGIHCLYRKNHHGATTQKLCGLLEEVALTAEKYLHIPGLKHEVCRNFAVESHRIAAKFHLTSSLDSDPSTDASRAGHILLRAWRLKPTRIKHLVEGLRVIASNSFAGNQAKSQLPPPNPFPKSVPTPWSTRRSAA